MQQVTVCLSGTCTTGAGASEAYGYSTKIEISGYLRYTYSDGSLCSVSTDHDLLLLSELPSVAEGQDGLCISD